MQCPAAKYDPSGSRWRMAHLRTRSIVFFFGQSASLLHIENLAPLKLCSACVIASSVSNTAAFRCDDKSTVMVGKWS